MKTCETCRWWKPAFNVANYHEYAGEWGHPMFFELGYCEPPPLVHPSRWKGLTAASYSCGEWKEKTDDT